MNEKKGLSARRYLNQLAVIDEQINQDLERLADMKADATSTGAIDYAKDHVQTSKVGDKLCSDVVRYVTLDEHINQEIDRFVDAKEHIIAEIRGLHKVTYVQVLYKVYVQYKSLKQAAQEMKKSYSYAIDLHKKALSAFEDKYKNLHYRT